MKSYARGNGRSYERLDSDKGLVSYYNYYEFNQGFTGLNNVITIISLFVLLNLIVLTLTVFTLKPFVQLVSQNFYFKKIVTKYYWNTVAISALLNLVWYSYNTIPIILSIALADKNNKQIIIVLIITMLLLIVIPIVSWCATEQTNIPVPTIFAKLFCCYCLCGLCSLRTKSRLIHTLSLSHILWFIHKLVSASIIVICHFVIAPAQVLAVVVLFFSAIICTIFLSSLMCSSCTCTLKSTVRFFGLLFFLLQVLAVLVFFTLFYIYLADNGLESDGIGGIFLSLIPPAIFFLVGLIVERRFIHNTNRTSLNEEVPEVDQKVEPVMLEAVVDRKSIEQPLIQ